MAFPSTTLPSNAAIAGPASTSRIHTNAKPRERPVAGWVISRSLRTVPSGAKRPRIVSGVVSESGLPRLLEEQLHASKERFADVDLFGNSLIAGHFRIDELSSKELVRGQRRQEPKFFECDAEVDVFHKRGIYQSLVATARTAAIAIAYRIPTLNVLCLPMLSAMWKATFIYPSRAALNAHL
jgi:hypothetical protein